MKKKLSVIISVICIIVSLGSISGTLYYAKNHNTSSMMQQAGGTPPSMPNKGENSQNNESNQQDSSQNNKSSNDQSNSQNQDSNDQTNENSNGQAPNNQQGASGQSNSQPTMPGKNQQNNNQPGQMNQEMTSSSQSLNALQIVIISICVLVFMLSKNSFSLSSSPFPKLIFSLSIIKLGSTVLHILFTSSELRVNMNTGNSSKFLRISLKKKSPLSLNDELCSVNL